MTMRGNRRKNRRAGRSLTDRTVVITGAGSGIGRSLALECAGRGARLALSDVDLHGLAETGAQVERSVGRSPRLDRLDVRDREAWHAYAEALATDLGTVHVLVNNAGVTSHGSFLELDHDLFARVVDVDFWGVVHGSRAFLPHLVASGDGHLVNVSSLFGLMAVPGQSAYNAAKFAVRGFTESLRQEMLLDGHPVTVTCVHPGGVRTAIARNAVAPSGVDVAETVRFFDERLARTSPGHAAAVIVEAMLAGRPRVLVGADAAVLDKVVRVAGPAYQRLVTRVVPR